MRSAVLAAASLAMAVLAVSVCGAQIQSGLKPGQGVPAFDVIGANGADKGEKYCRV